MKSLILMLVALATSAGAAETPPPIKLFDAAELGPRVAPSEATLKRIGPKGSVAGRETHIAEPTIVVYAAEKPNGAAVIVCPGGGYGILAETHEGSEVAKRLNAFGSAAVVLKYRVPRRDPNKPWIVPVLDARETLRIVRARAAEWNADPKKIGILGFSAGGNLAARVAYAPDAPDAPRPDFAVMVYPAYLFEKDKPDSVLREGPDGVVPPKGVKPVPAFFAHSADDPYPAEGSMAFAKLLKSMGGSAEVHVWAKGGHGWGASERCLAARRWTDLLGEWMKDQGLLQP